MAVPPIVMSHLIYAAFRGMDDTVAGLLAQHPAALNAVCEVGGPHLVVSSLSQHRTLLSASLPGPVVPLESTWPRHAGR